MTETRIYTVTGMSCGHCESAVTQEVSQLAGVADIQVSSAAGSLTITVQDDATVTNEAVIAAVDEAGYSASPARLEGTP